MSTTKREFISGNYYHIYNRGSSKQKIYLDEGDKNRFVQLLFLCNGEKSFQFADIPMKTLFDFSFDRGLPLIDICSWVLMNNHFHLLIFIEDGADSKNLSKFMSRLTAAYLKYFNEKYNRTGGLFEGRFQSILVDNDIYLKYLYSYIHLNPLKMLDKDWKTKVLKIKNATNYLKDYKYSSLNDLLKISNRFEKNILTNNNKVLEISKLVNTMEKLEKFIKPTNLDPRGSRK